MPLRLVFMGTPDFAVPTLLELAGSGRKIAAVYTRAAKPGGRRGLEVSPELQNGLKQFRVAGLPEAATVDVGAQLADGGDELAGAHLRDDLGEFFECGEQF